MSDLEKTLAIVRYFLNNCVFDRNGKSDCGIERQ